MTTPTTSYVTTSTTTPLDKPADGSTAAVQATLERFYEAERA
ncbi:hypothetical protein [Streptomyces sp. MST-110588]|nr:hypothetical protein [Streptomyces sp. MST-110588]